MRRRLLNIASIVCLVVCVALIGLWARSYFYRYALEVTNRSGLLRIVSERGILDYRDVRPKPTKNYGIVLQEYSQGKTFDSSHADSTDRVGIEETMWGYRWTTGAASDASFFEASFPIWPFVVASAAMSLLLIFPFSRRFGLRTLFVVTTFLALVLGMIALLDQAWIGK
jgi:hypothetical protein